MSQMMGDGAQLYQGEWQSSSKFYQGGWHSPSKWRKSFIREGGVAPQNGEKCQRHLSHASLAYCINDESKESKCSQFKTSKIFKYIHAFL